MTKGLQPIVSHDTDGQAAWQKDAMSEKNAEIPLLLKPIIVTEHDDSASRFDRLYSFETPSSTNELKEKAVPDA
jgi:hypothetical protein